VKPLSISVGLVLGFAAGVHFARLSSSDVWEVSRLHQRGRAETEITTRLSEQVKTDREIIEKLVDRLRDRGNAMAPINAPFHSSRMIEL
jgi:hypothetical protein